MFMKSESSFPGGVPTAPVPEPAQAAETPAGKPVRISVIIPAHNEEAFLPATLKALREQTWPDFEVIVVANGCADNTAEAANGLCDQLFCLEERGLGRARNLGGFRARGEILVFLDADTFLDKEALAMIARQFDRRYSMGTLKGVPDGERFSHRLIYFFKNLIHRLHLHTGSSGVILCWKDQFGKIGGFDEHLYLRENSELMKRLRVFGRYKFIGSASARTSMRRYDETGTGKMVWLWFKLWALSFFVDLRHKTYEAVTPGQKLSPFAQWVGRLKEKRNYKAQARDVSA